MRISILLPFLLLLVGCAQAPDPVREAVLACQNVRPAGSEAVIVRRSCSRSLPDWAQGCTAQEWRQGYVNPPPAPPSLNTTSKTSPYWRCVRNDAAATGADPTAVYLLTERLKIADQADAGTLKGDDLDLAIAKLDAEAEQEDRANIQARDQHIEMLNSF